MSTTPAGSATGDGSHAAAIDGRAGDDRRRGGYVGGRQPGVGGFFSLFRGGVREAGGMREVMWTRTPRIAGLVAAALNGELAPKRIGGPRGLRRYSVQPDPRSHGPYLILGAMPTVRDPSRFGFGPVAHTDDPQLAKRVIEALNELDPENAKRAVRGIGWW